MAIFGSSFTKIYPATCRVTGTTCRPNVRSGSFEAVPAWLIAAGWIAVVVGCAVIGVTW